MLLRCVENLTNLEDITYPYAGIIQIRFLGFSLQNLSLLSINKHPQAGVMLTYKIRERQYLPQKVGGVSFFIMRYRSIVTNYDQFSLVDDFYRIYLRCLA